MKPFKPVPRKYRSDKMDFEKMIAKGEGEGPDGFCAETVNGSAYWRGTGWNRQMTWERPQAPEGGAWQGGRNNRTGE